MLTPSVYVDELPIEYYIRKRVRTDSSSVELVYEAGTQDQYELTTNPYEDTTRPHIESSDAALLSKKDYKLNLNQIIGEGNFGKGKM